MIKKIRTWFIGDYLSTTTDFYERARIEVNFNFLFGISLILFTLSVPHLLAQAYSVATQNLSGGAICLVQLLLLKRLKNVNLNSKIFVVVICIQMFYNQFFNPNLLHIGDLLWMTLTILYATYNLGIAWGAGLTGVVVGLSSLYIQTLAKKNFAIASAFPDKLYSSAVIEITVAFSAILYMIWVFLKASTEAQEELKRNFNDLQQKNIVITKQHEEKVVMMKEIHHRVKNNLQVVNSLLRLKSIGIQDQSAAKAFQDAQQRIIAIALIHQRMYKSEDLSNIEIEKYFHLLAEDLIKQYSTTQQIDLKIDIKLKYVGHKSIVPIGLILNEMICNSIIHGIKEKGEIHILGQHLSDGVELSYSDNGKGFNSSHSKGFGLELIQILTEQLNGRVNVKSEIGKGTYACFTFPSLN